MKGWYGNRQAHGLASKGIRTRARGMKNLPKRDTEYYYNLIQEYMKDEAKDHRKYYDELYILYDLLENGEIEVRDDDELQWLVDVYELLNKATQDEIGHWDRFNTLKWRYRELSGKYSARGYKVEVLPVGESNYVGNQLDFDSVEEAFSDEEVLAIIKSDLRKPGK